MNELCSVLLGMNMLVPHLAIGSWVSGMGPLPPSACRAWHSAPAGEGIPWYTLNKCVLGCEC